MTREENAWYRIAIVVARQTQKDELREVASHVLLQLRRETRRISFLALIVKRLEMELFCIYDDAETEKAA